MLYEPFTWQVNSTGTGKTGFAKEIEPKIRIADFKNKLFLKSLLLLNDIFHLKNIFKETKNKIIPSEYSIIIFSKYSCIKTTF